MRARWNPQRTWLVGQFVILIILIIKESVTLGSFAMIVKTNKLRYASDNQVDSNQQILKMHQIVELKSSSQPRSMTEAPYHASSAPKRISRNNNFARRQDEAQGDEQKLDEEDIGLLDKFYQDTKNNDPFLSDSLSMDDLWRELQNQEVERVNALTDNNNHGTQHQGNEQHQGHQEEQHDHNVVGPEQQDVVIKNKTTSGEQAPTTDPGWSLDPDLTFSNEMNKLDEMLKNNVPSENGQAEGDNQMKQNEPQTTEQYQQDDDQQEHEHEQDHQQAENEARYSPTVKLLTGYDPLRDSPSQGFSMKGLPKDKIVGATLYGHGPDLSSKPKVSSKSATVALKLHDELMKEPPKDGKVRVRMYYHRAMHDDKRLFGNGPWKYWGHGWGLEFGFDPKKTSDSYQRGYTIERAFGRDFCLKSDNCRQADPEFFKTIHDAGKYSKQHFRSSFRAHKLPI